MDKYEEKEYTLYDGRKVTVYYDNNGVAKVTKECMEIIMRDFVPVVRCGECVSSYECCDGTLRCDDSFERNNIDRTVSADWFCADGKRKGGQ